MAKPTDGQAHGWPSPPPSEQPAWQLLFRPRLEQFESLTLPSTVTWIGGLGDWDTAANWSTGLVPGGGDDVVINAGSPAHGLTTTDAVHRLTNSVPVAIAAGTLTVGTGTSQINAAVTVSSGATLALNSSTVNGSGTLTNSGTMNITHHPGGQRRDGQFVAQSSTVGQSVTFTTTVTAVAPGSGTPTGTVTFMDGTNSLGMRTFSGGMATFTTSTLTAGTHSITVVYGGDGNFTGRTSAALSQAVNSSSGVPVVTGVSPNSGSTAGGTVVTILGSHFTGVSKVEFGATLATRFTVVSDTRITATAPAHVAGTVDPRVVNGGVTSAATTADKITYIPAAGPAGSGGRFASTLADLASSLAAVDEALVSERNRADAPATQSQRGFRAAPEMEVMTPALTRADVENFFSAAPMSSTLGVTILSGEREA